MPKINNLDLDYIFENTSGFINQWNEKTILLTGGTGFIGKWLLEYFLFLNKQKKLNFTVFVLSRDPNSFLEKFPGFNVPFIQFIKGNIVDFDYNELNTCDFIIHAATDADAKKNLVLPLSMIDTIVEGTRRVLDYGVRVNAKKILYLSSGAVYGIQPDNLKAFPENFSGGPDVLSASSAYSEAKRLAELLCVCYQKQYQLNVSIARCFAFVCPYLPLDKHFAIGNFIGDGLSGNKIIIKGNGLPLRSYMYAADLVIWLLYILFKGESGQAYNVGSDASISIKDLGLEVATNFNDLPVLVLDEVNETDRNQNYIPDVKKIRSELGVPDIINLSEAIRRTVKFYREDD